MVSRQKHVAHPAPEPAPSAPAAPRVRRDVVLLAAVAVVALLAVGFWLSQPRNAGPSPASTPEAPVLSTPGQQALTKAQLVELALKHPDVQAYVQRNPGYFAENKQLSQQELDAQAQRYPVIYGGLRAPVYELRLSAGSGEGLLVLLNNLGVLKVFAVQSLRVG